MLGYCCTFCILKNCLYFSIVNPDWMPVTDPLKFPVFSQFITNATGLWWYRLLTIPYNFFLLFSFSFAPEDNIPWALRMSSYEFIHARFVVERNWPFTCCKQFQLTSYQALKLSVQWKSKQNAKTQTLIVSLMHTKCMHENGSTYRYCTASKVSLKPIYLSNSFRSVQWEVDLIILHCQNLQNNC